MATQPQIILEGQTPLPDSPYQLASGALTIQGQMQQQRIGEQQLTGLSQENQMRAKAMLAEERIGELTKQYYADNPQRGPLQATAPAPEAGAGLPAPGAPAPSAAPVVPAPAPTLAAVPAPGIAPITGSGSDMRMAMASRGSTDAAPVAAAVAPPVAAPPVAAAQPARVAPPANTLASLAPPAPARDLRGDVSAFVVQGLLKDGQYGEAMKYSAQSLAYQKEALSNQEAHAKLAQEQINQMATIAGSIHDQQTLDAGLAEAARRGFITDKARRDYGNLGWDNPATQTALKQMQAYGVKAQEQITNVMAEQNWNLHSAEWAATQVKNYQEFQKAGAEILPKWLEAGAQLLSQAKTKDQFDSGIRVAAASGMPAAVQEQFKAAMQNGGIEAVKNLGITPVRQDSREDRKQRDADRLEESKQRLALGYASLAARTAAHPFVSPEDVDATITQIMSHPSIKGNPKATYGTAMDLASNYELMPGLSQEIRDRVVQTLEKKAKANKEGGDSPADVRLPGRSKGSVTTAFPGQTVTPVPNPSANPVVRRPPPAGQVSVQIPGYAPGFIDQKSKAQFLRDNPTAKVL